MDGRIFHILNRGIEKRRIFETNRDYTRFVCGLHRFNNKGEALRLYGDPEDYFKTVAPQKKLVNILKWTLMPNHYHILVEEVDDGGAIEFAKRIGNGYTKYFNTKNERSGYLFQNKARIIEVLDESHLLHLPFYIDSNPIELIFLNQEKSKISDKQEKILNFLKSYRWSSFADYAGGNNFPEVIDKKSFSELYEINEDEYLKNFSEWLVDNCRRGTSTEASTEVELKMGCG